MRKKKKFLCFGGCTDLNTGTINTLSNGSHQHSSSDIDNVFTIIWCDVISTKTAANSHPEWHVRKTTIQTMSCCKIVERILSTLFEGIYENDI